MAVSLVRFFGLLGVIGLPLLITWYLFSSLGRIIRGIEDIALTLRRIEQNEHRNGLS